MNIYLVMQNSDLTEGRGPMIFKAAFLEPGDALKYAKAIEPYGAEVSVGRYKSSYAYGQFTEVVETNLFENFASKVDIDNEIKRKEALQKLTAEERKLLGL